MIVADTSGLLALFNTAEPHHGHVRAIIDAEREPLVVSPYVLAELDYLVATRIGTVAELAVLEEMSAGAYELPAFDAVAIGEAARIVERYNDQAIGLADASIVVLAHRYGTRRILTLDHRHFDVVRPLAGGRFSVVP